MSVGEYFDQFSCLHLASGITAYFWGLSLKKWIFYHIAFSIFENSSLGISLSKKYLSNFRAYKMGPDSLKNLIGDTIGALLGWLLAYSMEQLAKSNKVSGRAKIHDESVKTRLSTWLNGHISKARSTDLVSDE